MAYRGDGSRNRGGGRGDSAQPGGRGNADRGGRGRDASKTAVGNYSPDVLSKISKAYRDPSRKLDTPENQEKARRAMNSNSGVGPQTPGSIPNFPLADPLYGPTRLLESIGPLGPITAPLREAGVMPSSTDALGLERGPQIGYTNGNRREETNPQGNNAGESQKEEEERRRRRLAAQQTALGADPNSLLGPGVLPI